MPEDAPLDGGAPREVGLVGPFARVSGMQVKLHRWAVADPGRRFDDLFNFVCDPATLIVAFSRVAGNRGARTPGVDGLTVADVEAQVGVPGFLDDLRAQLRQGTFRALPVRERMIPKPGGSGKVRRLGIPTVADRVVQAALKLVLEPIFEADFLAVSYGFRPRRRVQDAIAETQFYGTHGYRWVLDADIKACFDEIGHTPLMDRVRLRVKDKRVLALVKAFLKAGIMTELGEHQDTHTGTPQGGLCAAAHKDPCGVPRSRISIVPSACRTGAWSPRLTYSTTHGRSVLASTAWTTRSHGTVSKNFWMSRSITQSRFQHRRRQTSTASCGARPGR
jgi:RNA-directed DNA polymerase